MEKEIIVCKRCGTSDDYHIEVKSNNHCAYCNGCGMFLKNIPYTEPALYFGKYKGMKISDIHDKPYLEWLMANVQLKGHIKEAVIEQINAIKTNA